MAEVDSINGKAKSNAINIRYVTPIRIEWNGIILFNGFLLILLCCFRMNALWDSVKTQQS